MDEWLESLESSGVCLIHSASGDGPSGRRYREVRLGLI